jgi:hypothetical protein
MLRLVLGVLAGVAAGFATVFLIELISGKLYPMPAGLDPTNAEGMKAYIAGLPGGAFALVLAAMTLGAFDAAAIAAVIAGRRRVAGWIAGGFIVAATVVNVIAIPHPVWFAAASVVLAATGAWLGAALGGERRAV